MPFFSIITINLNNAEGLQKTIDSVLAQELSNFEYIVIDGASTDGSIEMANRYKNSIMHFASEPDNGIYHAMNKGIAKATGAYCLFLNSGDFLVDEHVLQIVFDAHQDADIIYGDMMIDNGTGKLLYGKQPAQLAFEFMINDTLWHPVAFIKRDLFNKFGLYNEASKFVADYEFFLKTIIVEEVVTQYLPFPISVFNTLGVGSVKEFEAERNAERLIAQQKYFPKKVIDSAKQFYDLKKSKAVLLSQWIKQFPILNGILSGVFNVLLKVRKIISR